MLRPAVVLTLILTPGLTAQAEEAVLPDGARLTGKLSSGPNGRVRFQSGDRSVGLPGLIIRFAGSAKSALRPALFRITLRDGSAFAADLLGLDATRLQVRTAWAEELRLPRSGIAAVTSLEESTTTRREDFAAVGKKTRGPGEPELDEVWLASGDQAFGQVTLADREGLTLQVRARPRNLRWNDVRELRFALSALEPRTTEGEHVRIWFRSAAGEPDTLEGVLRSLDEKQATLTHPVLSEVKLESDTLLRLHGLFYGRRQEIDQARHHLGDPDRLSAILVPRRAEGTSLKRSFRLVEAPTMARLRLSVSELQTDGTGRLELWINARLVTDLSRLVDRRIAEPVAIALDLPAGSLRAGANELELRLTPLRDSERHPSCGVSGLTLELPR